MTLSLLKFYAKSDYDVYNKWNHKPENKVLTESGVRSDAHSSDYKVWLKTIFPIQSVSRQTLLLHRIFVLTLLRATRAMCRLFAPLVLIAWLFHGNFTHNKIASRGPNKIKKCKMSDLF